jgi:murein L,D-transpeptidase YafK
MVCRTFVFTRRSCRGALALSASLAAAAPFAGASKVMAQNDSAAENASVAAAADAASGSAVATPPAGASDKTPSNLLRLGRGSSFYSPFAFLVDKKARTLSVWKQLAAQWQKVASYPADLGKNEGVKTKRNDHRTPEGIYFLKDRLEGASLDFNLYGKRAFTTDYPNFFDRFEGKTGSGIWLHAVPDKTPLTRGSRGCVVVRNDAIIELSKYVDLGKTPVVIADQIDYVKKEDAALRAEEIAGSIERWRQAWENKDIAGYIAFYGSRFRSQEMGRAAWKAYKDRLNSTYKQLSVKLSKPYIIAYKDRAVARFMQDYASDLHQDFGEKTLYLTRENGKFLIAGEEWAEETSRLAREEMNANEPSSGETASAMPASTAPSASASRSPVATCAPGESCPAAQSAARY